MGIKLDKLFDHKGLGLSADSLASREEIFGRAYRKQFEAVSYKLDLGFSVLVYLPGNCMAAAAEYVQKGQGGWKDYGQHPEVGNIFDAWEKEAPSMAVRLRKWLKPGASGDMPKAIFHNLDFLSDGRGGMNSQEKALGAIFSLLEATRNGVVLGLSDREAGKLPDAIERAFAEKVWINEISFDSFAKIIPRDLGEQLADEQNGELPDGTAWLIASRLRWTDPIRAVKIMQNVRNQKELSSILGEIWQSTRTVDFVDPEKALPSEEEKVTGFNEAELNELMEWDSQEDWPKYPEHVIGFEKETIEILERCIIAPFDSWKGFTGGTRQQCEGKFDDLPTGVIFHGPPGTGKTLLARWIANRIGLPIRPVNATDIKASPYGEAEKNVHLIFAQARRAAPCVFVLDDADDLLPDRARAFGSVAAAERGIVNATLQELYGFYGKLTGVLVIMTTNRFPSLDPAAKQRFPLHRRIPYPVTPDQVREIVNAIAGEFYIRRGIRLVKAVRDKLAERFFAPVVRTTDAMAELGSRWNNEGDRRWLDKNLFSPREIRQAIQLLVSMYGEEPKAEDVDEMDRKYYQSLGR